MEKLKDWKAVIVPLYKILIWEKQWHPFAIAGGILTLYPFFPTNNLINLQNLLTCLMTCAI